MADWRQIQARIRKAKAGADPPAQLAALYEKTRDAMVAFELARLSEQSGQNEEAARWYTTAAQRFRRAQWKTKAEEALARLGAPIPASSAAETPAASESAIGVVVETSAAFAEMPVEQAGLPVETTVEKTDGAGEEAGQPRRRRRGRRGGRGRRRKGARRRRPHRPSRPQLRRG